MRLVGTKRFIFSCCKISLKIDHDSIVTMAAFPTSTHTYTYMYVFSMKLSRLSTNKAFSTAFVATCRTCADTSLTLLSCLTGTVHNVHITMSYQQVLLMTSYRCDRCRTHEKRSCSTHLLTSLATYRRDSKWQILVEKTLLLPWITFGSLPLACVGSCRGKGV